ncbi:hypothetical protein IAU59_004578 [Kwoniella sp. CBS 9459]
MSASSQSVHSQTSQTGNGSDNAHIPTAAADSSATDSTSAPGSITGIDTTMSGAIPADAASSPASPALPRPASPSPSQPTGAAPLHSQPGAPASASSLSLGIHPAGPRLGTSTTTAGPALPPGGVMTTSPPPDAHFRDQNPPFASNGLSQSSAIGQKKKKKQKKRTDQDSISLEPDSVPADHGMKVVYITGAVAVVAVGMTIATGAVTSRWRSDKEELKATKSEYAEFRANMSSIHASPKTTTTTTTATETQWVLPVPISEIPPDVLSALSRRQEIFTRTDADADADAVTVASAADADANTDHLVAHDSETISQFITKYLDGDHPTITVTTGPKTPTPAQTAEASASVTLNEASSTAGGVPGSQRIHSRVPWI